MNSLCFIDQGMFSSLGRVGSHIITVIISRSQTVETVCWVSLRSKGRRCVAFATPAVTDFPFFHNVKFSLGCSPSLSGGKTTC